MPPQLDQETLRICDDAEVGQRLKVTRVLDGIELVSDGWFIKFEIYKGLRCICLGGRNSATWHIPMDNVRRIREQ